MYGKRKGPKYHAPTIDIIQAKVEEISLVKPLKKPDIPKAPIKTKEIQSIAII